MFLNHTIVILNVFQLFRLQVLRNLSIYLSVYLSICLSVYLCVCVSVCPCVRVSVCPCVRVSVCPCVRVSVCPCVRVSVCPSVCLSVCRISMVFHFFVVFFWGGGAVASLLPVSYAYVFSSKWATGFSAGISSLLLYTSSTSLAKLSLLA
jgi:hypothetical protein